MFKNISAFYDYAQDKLISACISCGKCVSQCKVMNYIPDHGNPSAIQRDILSFLRNTAVLSDIARAKINACMKCYGCTGIDCPVGIDSLTINELVLRKLHEQETYPNETDMYAVNRKQIGNNTSAAERARISAPVWKHESDFVFFPGCNVYKQPDKLLNALDIMDAIGNDYSFIPGMEYCCGMSLRGINGDAD